MSMPEWSEDRVAKLMAMWSTNVSLEDIQDALKATRNSVLGKARRLGLIGRSNHITPKCGRAWTADEVEVARRLKAEKASNERCIAEIGRTFAAIETQLAKGKWSTTREASRARFKAEALARETEAQARFDAASRRLTAPRSLTAWAFGDPPPGHSALDRGAGGIS